MINIIGRKKKIIIEKRINLFNVLSKIKNIGDLQINDIFDYSKSFLDDCIYIVYLIKNGNPIADRLRPIIFVNV